MTQGEWYVENCYDSGMHRLVINIYGGYEIKEDLKSLGYEWDNLNKSWSYSMNSTSVEYLEDDLLEYHRERLLGVGVSI